MSRSAKRVDSFHGFPIEIFLEIDGSGKSNIDTGIGMFNHLLELFAKHGGFDLTISTKGDLHVDDHHMIDEIGMNLGLAFKHALNTNKNETINRYGFFVLPMDEVLSTCAIDFCGRSSFVFDVKFKREKIGGLSTEMIQEFWSLFSKKAEVNFIAKCEYGTNDHHIAESLFKCTARAVSMALTLNKVK